MVIHQLQGEPLSLQMRYEVHNVDQQELQMTTYLSSCLPSQSVLHQAYAG